MSLFGTPQPAQAGGGLFGGAANTAQKPAGGMFGASAGTGTQTSGGLFGATPNQQQSTPATGGGLFGSSTSNQTQQPQQSGGLFGSSTAQKPAGGGLFGGLRAIHPTATTPATTDWRTFRIEYGTEARGRRPLWSRTIDSTTAASATAADWRTFRWAGPTAPAISAGTTASAVAIRPDNYGYATKPTTTISVLEPVVSWPRYHRR
ncbi:hypothetical protein N7481_009594 [Penicillium waksmanii]|uniref:uncharacterized protein n=1 Tax=Penicillium waksmanii TaxID=69791 RepID=UPI0025484DE6|nr:uncharacterized protein N7481_009594 [Penicillium waksmanii]KAJ5975887.1 hypothetical protein N7481_009594 [Penicillium waksmanii]